MKKVLKRRLRKGISVIAACAIMATNFSPWLVTSYASEVPEEALYENADDFYGDTPEEYLETPIVTEAPEAVSTDTFEEGYEEPTEDPDAAEEYEPSEAPDEYEDSESSGFYETDEEDPDGDGIAVGEEVPDEASDEGIFEEESETPGEDAVEEESETPDGQILENAPSAIFEASTDEVRVNVVAGVGVFPEGTTMEVAPAEDEETISSITDTVADEHTEVKTVKAVEVTFFNEDHEEIEPNGPVLVTLEDLVKDKESESDEITAKAVHVTDEGDCTVIPEASDEDIQYFPVEWEEEKAEENDKIIEQITEAADVTFLAESFSTYALVYTVEFHWEANGNSYEFILSGGDTISFRELVQSLYILGEQEEGSEKEDKFISDIENIRFSDESLLLPVQISEEMTGGGIITAGELKAALGLEDAYSSDLTEEQIESMDAKEFSAPDWALISLAPFDTTEYLTVNMKNGDQFTIAVTDTQQKPVTNLNDLDGKEFALVNVNQSAVVLPVAQDTAWNDNQRLQALALSENNLTVTTPTWLFEKVEGTENQFYISSGGQYLNINQTNNPNITRSDKANVGDVTLGTTPQALRVSIATNDGAVRIENTDNFRLDLWNWDPGQGFGAYKNSSNPNNQQFKLVPIFKVEENKPFVIYHIDQQGKFRVLGVNSDLKICQSEDELDQLPSAYKWFFRHVYDENGDFYYEVSSASNSQYKLSLTGNGEDYIHKGSSTIVVSSWANESGPENGVQFSFKPYGYSSPVYLKNEGAENSYFYSSTAFSGDMEQTKMFLYEQKPLETIQFTVKSEDPNKGLVADASHPGENGAGLESFTTIAQVVQDGTGKKYNSYEINALGGGPEGLSGENKYIFDYWELDGNRIEAGATITAETQEIPESGSVLTACYKRNPDYIPKNADKHGQFIDKDSLQDWLNELRQAQMPLDPDGCSKTAELYDYENRIYRVDLTARSSLSTFAGTIDLGFMIDISASMKFPSKLSAIVGKEQVNLWKINENNYNKQNFLTQRTDPYYIIADESGTATVCEIKWNGSNWIWKDASKKDSEFKTITSNKDTMGNQFHKTDAEKYKSGTTVLYQVYDDADVGKKRFHYLENSISGTKSTLHDILDILTLSENNADNPDVKIAWNTFCNTLGTDTVVEDGVTKKGQSHEFVSAREEINLNYAYDGGTSTDIALLDAAGYKRSDVVYQSSHSNWNYLYNDGYEQKRPNQPLTYTDDYSSGFQWDNSATKYAVLITDGAPQRSGKSIDDKLVQDAADLLRSRGVTLITVGLSMGNVDRGRVLLYDIASKDEENDPYFYEANSGDELQYVLYSIIQNIMKDCSVYGDVTDTVGEAFYPVDKETGKPLVAGDYIDLNGNLVSSAYDGPHGIINKSGDTYTVTWTGQEFTYSSEGWHGSIYVKAKEDFLGGDVVKTNKTNAEIEAKQYSVGDNPTKYNLASSRADYSFEIEDPEHPGQTMTITSKYDTKIDNLKSPRVNVNELDFTQNSTAWTVYVGTEVNPKLQIQALYEGIKVEEVVTAVDEQKPNQAKDENSLRFTVEESEWDDRTPSGTPVTFYLKDLITELEREPGQPTLDWDTLITMANGDSANNTGITFRYDKYTPDYQNQDVNDRDYPSNINIKLVKNGNLESHTTETIGSPVETYSILVTFTPDYEYLPVSQKGNGQVDYHTGFWGLGQPGAAAGTETSTNNHRINVLKRELELFKTGDDGNVIKEAKFEIYKKDGSGNKTGTNPITTRNGTFSWDPLVPEEDRKVPGNYWKDETIFYIKEVEAPEDYALYDGEIPVSLNMEDVYTNLFDTNSTSAVYPYNWTQTPSIVANAVDGHVTVTTKEQDILEPVTGESSGRKETVGISIAVKNTLSIDIDIIKTNMEAQHLSGATFKLMKGDVLMKSSDYSVIKKGSAGTNQDIINIDSNGYFIVPEEGATLKDLGVGTYSVIEVSAPDGYNIYTKPVTFTIRENEASNSRVTFDNERIHTGMVTATPGDHRRYTIKNEPGEPLPETGGPGTRGFLYTGLALMLFATMAAFVWRRKRI